MPEKTKGPAPERQVSDQDRSDEPTTAEEKNINQQAEKAAVRAQQTIKHYESEHDIFTK